MSGKVKLLRYLANLGYGSRREVLGLLGEERVTDAAGELLYGDDVRPHEDIRIDGEALDPAPGLLLMLNKPAGVTCSTKDQGKLVYDLLPKRFRLRSPVVSPVGRLDRDTSGLLLFTDDGQLLHKIISPKSKLPKVYIAELANDLRGNEVATFASGTLMLESETTPLLPAELDVLGPRRARLTLHEGRYHQVRRMFAAVGNHVESLHRERVGGLTLGDLPEGEWRLLGDVDRVKLFA
ncbi:pseudouridine synthase [Solilutibacter tolerans]|uniref:Pseudouridine synthase n=1 Tax=Solilutibacter tolerans TaxID=1604334 RepID=A0A1N6Y9V8_9GAMM|nr:pseudouridine synthase [Lysobacter tolerans]SIR11259.1 ribosomal small subunit pseudouridine synthase A [Lysobacter tolerans]